MFCDVVGSTGLSQRRDVESYFSVVQAYYDICQSVITRHGGFIAQHHGDGIYIWFGYPRPAEDDAARAVRAGLELIELLKRVSIGLEAELGEPLEVRIAAHAGEVLVASVENESGPLAFGLTPNLAAKLQQSARPGTVVISTPLLRLVEGDFDVTPRRGAVLSDGAVVPAYEVLGARRRVGRIAGPWRTPFVARQREREVLERAWSAVRNGPGRTVAIVGDRGLGKTRLASAFSTEATADIAGVTVLDCACSRIDASTTYRTLRVLLAQAAGIERDDPPIVSAARLHEHVLGALGMDDQAASILGAILGIPEEAVGQPPRLDPLRLAQVTATTFVEWVHRLAAAEPTMLVIDDVAEADPSSLAILGGLAAKPPPNLLIIVTAHAARMLPAPVAAADIEVIELSPLVEMDAEELLSVVTTAAPLDPHVSEQVLRQSEGVPLYLEELARTAQELAQTELPITLTGQLQARLGAPGVDRTAVAVLAAAGQEVDQGVLGLVLQVDGDALRDRVAGLVSRDLVVHVTDPGSRYRFRHGLIAEAAYGLLLKDQKIGMHGRLADAMVEWHRLGHRVDWNVVGHHLDLADRVVEAFEATLRGADEARVAGPSEETFQGYRDALGILDRVTDIGVRERLEIRCRVQRGATAISARGWGADEAIEDFARCAELCRKLGPRPEHLAAMTGVFSFYLVQGELALARRIAEEVRAWVDAAYGGYRADNAMAFGVLCFYEGDYTGALEHLRRAARLFEQQGMGGRVEQIWLMPFDTLVITLAHLANVLWITGSPGEASAAADQAMARASTLPFPEGPFSMAYTKSWLAYTDTIAGHHRTAAQLAAEVTEIGRRHGFVFWESSGEIHRALAEYGIRARPDAADTVSMQAAFWELIRSRVYLPYVLTAEANIRAESGQGAQAAAGFDAAGRLAEETGSLFYEAERLRLLAATGLLPGTESRAMLTRSRELARRQGATLFELRAALDLARLDPVGESARALRAVVGDLPAGVGYPELNEARALLARSASPA